MPVIVCMICSVLIWVLAEHRKSSLVQIFLLNMLLTIGIYAYYVGYSAACLKAAFCIFSSVPHEPEYLGGYGFEAVLSAIPPNAFYCSAIAIVVAVLLCAVRRHGRLRAAAVSEKADCHKVDYHLEASDRKMFWLIIAVSFLVRIVGVDWGGIGTTFHPDEGKVVIPPIDMAEGCTFMSDALTAPSQVTSKVLSIVFKLVMVTGELLGVEIDRMIYVVITRTYVAVLSVGVVVGIFLIGNHLKKHAGTMAAVLAAFFPPFIHAAHCATNDTFVGLCISAGILCAFHYLEEDRDFKWLSLMALVTVLAAFDKWHGVVACAIIAIAVCMKQIEQKKYVNIIIHGGFSLLLIIAATVLLVPNLAGNVQGIVQMLEHLTQDYATENSASFSQNAYAYVMWFISHMGIISLTFLITGILYAVRKKRAEFVLLLIGLIEIFGICLQDRHFIRWGYPFYVTLILLTGVGIVYGYEKMHHKLSKMMFGAAAALTCCNLLAGTLLLDVIFTNSQLDTRLVSEKWCLDNGIKQFDCVYDYYTCWYQGGMINKYPFRYLEVEAAVKKQGEGTTVNHLGRVYAVARFDEDKDARHLMQQVGGVEKVYFKADCIYNSTSFGDFVNVPCKVLEFSRIRFCIDMCIGILQKKMLFGRDIAIYDISMIPSYEICEYQDSELPAANIYWGEIDKIPRGEWNVEIAGEGAENASVYLEDADGVTVVSLEFIDGHAGFSVDRDYYLLTIKSDRKFDSVKFTPAEK